MKFPKHRKSQRKPSPSPDPQVPVATISASETQSLPVIIASAFTRLRIAQRVRVLRCLLQPVGPMALAVLGGGVFAKYIVQARWPRISVSLEDAARVTSGQVYELVRYIEQSNPLAVQQVLGVLARDTATMAALGGSLAAIVMQQVAGRNPARPPMSPREPA